MRLVLRYLILSSIPCEHESILPSCFHVVFITEDVCTSLCSLPVLIVLLLQPLLSLFRHLLPPLFLLSLYFLGHKVLDFMETSVFLFLLIVSVQVVYLSLQAFQVISNVGFSYSFLNSKQLLLRLFLMVEDLPLPL